MSDSNNSNQQVKTCCGDCLMCSVQQRVYCASQMTRHSITMLERIEERIDQLEQQVREMQAGTSGVFNPMSRQEPHNATKEAQEDSGVENRLSEHSINE